MKYVALLRGINVGGKHMLSMDKVRKAFEGAGAKSVTTYIQSGNVVLTHPQRSSAQLAGQLTTAIRTAAGFDVPVILRTATEWTEAIAATPFTEPDVLHCAFLPPQKTTTAQHDKLHAIDRDVHLPSRFELVGHQIYFHLPAGIGRDKLAASVLRIFSDATVRNWRTVGQLASMLAALA